MMKLNDESFQLIFKMKGITRTEKRHKGEHVYSFNLWIGKPYNYVIKKMIVAAENMEHLKRQVKKLIHDHVEKIKMYHM